MATSHSSGKTAGQFEPLRIKGQTKPVIGAEIGVPLAALERVADGEVAYVEVDPPSGGDPWEVNDIVLLWLEGEAEVLDREPVRDPDKMLTLRIPEERLHPDKVNGLSCEVIRGSDSIGTSEPLAALYNRIRPGGKDLSTVPGGHSELQLLLPDSIKNGVGPDFASAEICVAYPYCRAYDRIRLKCNDEVLEVDVGPHQAPQPPNPGSEVPITFCFTVERIYLDHARQEDHKLNFSFTVTDQLGNGPDTEAPCSPVVTVEEDLDGLRLPKAILLERMEDLPEDDASIIELVKLAGQPLLLIIVTTDTRFVVGYGVVATYTAKLPGQPDVVVDVRGTVEVDESEEKLLCILEVPNAKVIADSSVTVTYELRKPDGELVGVSRPASAQVIGGTTDKLLPPFLVPAVEPIDRLASPDGVTAWLLQVKDKPVWLEYVGRDKDDKEVIHRDRAGEPNYSADGFSRVLPLAWLKTLKDGSSLRIVFKVNLDGVANSATATVFPVRVYTVKTAGNEKPVISDVEAGGVSIPPGGSTAAVRVKVIGTGAALKQVQILDGGSVIATADVSDAGVWSEFVTLALGEHSLTAKALYGEGEVSEPPREFKVVSIPEGIINVGDILGGVAISPDGTRAYVIHIAGSTVIVIDLVQQTVIKRIGVGITPMLGIAVSPDGSRVYVCNGNSHNMSVIDTATLTVIQTIPVGERPYHMALSQDGRLACIMNNSAPGLLAVVDIDILRIVKSIPVSITYMDVVVSPDKMRAFLTDYHNSMLKVIDLVNSKEIDNIPTYTNPRTLAITADGLYIYVCSNDTTVTVIDVKKMVQIKQIRTGGGNGGGLETVVSPDGKRVYVMAIGAIYVIDVENQTLIGSIQLKGRGQAMAVTPDSSRIVVAHHTGGVEIIAVG